MTATEVLNPTGGALEHVRLPASSSRFDWLRDAMVLLRRNLVHIRREPAQLSDVTVQPILFTLLFTQLFGAAVVLPGGGSYVDFAIGGLLMLNLATSAPMGTAVGLGSDISSGIIDRFRTLAMRRSAIVVGRTFSDLLASVMCAMFVALAGLVVGWRPNHGVLGLLAGFGVALLFGYALSWFGRAPFTAAGGLIPPNDARASFRHSRTLTRPRSPCRRPLRGRHERRARTANRTGNDRGRRQTHGRARSVRSRHCRAHPKGAEERPLNRTGPGALYGCGWSDSPKRCTRIVSAISKGRPSVRSSRLHC
jgi:ABC-2 type transporter